MQFFIKHKRLFAFLIAFLLIFNTVFVNSSYAFFPAVALTPSVINGLVAGAIASGLIVTAQNIDYDDLYNYLATSWWNTLTYEEKLAFSTPTVGGSLVVSKRLFSSLANAVALYCGDTSSIPLFNVTGSNLKYVDMGDYSLPVVELPSSVLNSSVTGFNESAVINFTNVPSIMSYSGSPDNAIYADNFDNISFSSLLDSEFNATATGTPNYKTNISINLSNAIGVYGYLQLYYHNNPSIPGTYSWYLYNTPPASSTFVDLFVLSTQARPLIRYSFKCYFAIANGILFGITDFYDRTEGGTFAGQYIKQINATMDYDYSSIANTQDKSGFGSFILQNATTLDIPVGVDLEIDENRVPLTEQMVDGVDSVVVSIPEGFSLSNANTYTSADTNLDITVPVNPALSTEMAEIESYHDKIILDSDFDGFKGLFENYKSLIGDLNNLSWLIIANNCLFQHFSGFLILCCFFITVSRLIR